MPFDWACASRLSLMNGHTQLLGVKWFKANNNLSCEHHFSSWLVLNFGQCTATVSSFLETVMFIYLFSISFSIGGPKLHVILACMCNSM